MKINSEKHWNKKTSWKFERFELNFWTFITLKQHLSNLIFARDKLEEFKFSSQKSVKKLFRGFHSKDPEQFKISEIYLISKQCFKAFHKVRK